MASEEEVWSNCRARSALEVNQVDVEVGALTFIGLAILDGGGFLSVQRGLF